jgi:hypothetical protein
MSPALASIADGARRLPLPTSAGPVSCPATPGTEIHAEGFLNFFFVQVPPLHAALWQSRSEPVKALRIRCDERAQNARP